ncbi:MAG: hypothetical protein IJ757_00935 [Clostridiales bacterium]|nr:hypothetical protein [Clostridiales bacterium]
MIQKLKRPASFAAMIGILLGIGIISFAISNWFSSIGSQTSDYGIKTYFEFSVNEFFTESGEIGPGESKSINPIVTSDASIDSFVVIVVEMPKYSTGGLYTIDNSDEWVLVESWSSADGASWFEAYKYNDTLSAGAATTALGSTITMADMTNAQYGQLNDLNVTMTAYACGSDEGETLGTAWDTIKGYFRLGE